MTLLPLSDGYGTDRVGTRRGDGGAGWLVATLAIAALVAFPILAVASHLLVPAGDIWDHLATTVLPRYLANTAILTLGVGTGTAIIGVATAWLVTLCRFPGSRIMEWALLLPMAVPAYVIAYAYTDLLQFAGPVQTALREAFGWTRHDYWFPEIRSLGGAIAMMVLVLYPYVYLVTRAAFLQQSVCVLEVSRTLGRGPWDGFFTVALPLARPAIAASLALVMMEVLADFGTVQYFAVDTFTTGIYRTWFALGEPSAAAQLASILMGFVLVLVILERWSRRQAKFHHTTARYRHLPRYRLSRVQSLLAITACGLPVLLGFVIPALVLGHLAWGFDAHRFGDFYLSIAMNSLTLAGLTAVLAVVLGLVLTYGQRLHPTLAVRGAVRVAALGYAIPGSVIAVGTLIPFAAVDRWVDALAREALGLSTGLLLSGTIAVLLFAYLVRFLAVAFDTLDASLAKIGPNLDHAARVLGSGPSEALVRIHVPMLASGMLTAGLLVFVDVMKELPATLIVRPFNFDTLAVRAYQLAADERLAEAALPALVIVAAGILPVILLSRAISRTRPGDVATTGQTFAFER